MTCNRPLADTANVALLRLAFDNDSSSVPTSLDDIAGYSEIMDLSTCWNTGNVKKFNFLRPSIRGTPQTASMWYNETSPSSVPGSVKYYASGLNASTYYINYALDLLVEFQMRSS